MVIMMINKKDDKGQSWQMSAEYLWVDDIEDISYDFQKKSRNIKVLQYHQQFIRINGVERLRSIQSQ